MDGSSNLATDFWKFDTKVNGSSCFMHRGVPTANGANPFGLTLLNRCTTPIYVLVALIVHDFEPLVNIFAFNPIQRLCCKSCTVSRYHYTLFPSLQHKGPPRIRVHRRSNQRGTVAVCDPTVWPAGQTSDTRRKCWPTENNKSNILYICRQTRWHTVGYLSFGGRTFSAARILLCNDDRCFGREHKCNMFCRKFYATDIML